MVLQAKKIWSDDSVEIEEQLYRLNREKVPIVLAQKGCKSQVVYLHNINNKNNTLIFCKTKGLCYKKRTCFFLYCLPESPPRIFHGLPVRDSEKDLLINKPPVILERSRRKNPRIPTAGYSGALYLVPFSSRLYKGELKDVSREGFFIVSSYSSFLKKGLVIGPIELNLQFHSSAIDTIKVHIPEAMVIRVSKLENNMAEIAVHFKLKGNDLSKLENYLELREKELESNAHCKN